jgi:two-component sensor histidine kinase
MSQPGKSLSAAASFWRIAPGSFKAYAFAVLLAGVAAAVRWAFGFLAFDFELQAFTTFYPAVLLATLIGGAGPGIFAALFSAVTCWLFFLPPFTELLPLGLSDEINLLTFLISSLFIVWATDHYRRLTKQLRDEEHFRKLAVAELSHRLRNKVATIQAIVAFRLQAHPEIKDEINRALGALRSTDELIAAVQGKGARIRDVLVAELTAYEHSRISITGPDLLLPSKLALTFALLVHELATNAAKYGALSKRTGKLSVEWLLTEGRLSLVWREMDGPPVTPPTDSGFGTRLFQRALEQFDGTANADFAPTGLVCKLNVAIPEEEFSQITDTSDPIREAVSAD